MNVGDVFFTDLERERFLAGVPEHYMCRNCFSAQFMRVKEKLGSKIMIFGLALSGKSTFLNVLKSVELNSTNILKITPNSHLRIEYLMLKDNYIIWELGGTKRNINRLTTAPDHYLSGLSSFFFFHDITNDDNLERSITLFKDCCSMLEQLYEGKPIPEIYFFINKSDTLSKEQLDLKTAELNQQLGKMSLNINILESSLYPPRFISLVGVLPRLIKQIVGR